MKKKKVYDEASISVLKGLEPVKQRPGMYTKTENPLHILQEIIDNSADEAISGNADVVSIQCFKDGSFSVEDNGRGIPIGIHPVENIPTVELVFTRLHAGGKFNKTMNSSYNFSGGLHGVGVSVTNALSEKMDVSVFRDGYEWNIIFKNGVVQGKLTRLKKTKRTGTKIRAWPNSSYFDESNIPLKLLERSLLSKAILLPGVTFDLFDEKKELINRWCFPDGAKEYFNSRVEKTNLIVPVWHFEKYVETKSGFNKGEGLLVFFAFLDSKKNFQESFVNLIPTTGAGTHVSGFKEGVFSAIKGFADKQNLFLKGVKLISDDVFQKACFFISCKIFDPQFQGQTKERLSNRETQKLISSLVKDAYELWLYNNVKDARKICEFVITCAQERQRNQKLSEKKRVSNVAVLPGKLTDCQSTNILENEVFLVEGDSAGGSAKMGRNKFFQAILPLRGKILNSWEIDKVKLLSNTEVNNIATAIGIQAHDSVDQYDDSSLRYGKICILADADVDGAHIQVLLVTLFLKHFPGLVKEGRLFVARPPLYRIDFEGKYRKEFGEKIYILDDYELQEKKKMFYKKKIPDNVFRISRFKGLGEMSASQLWETTLSPENRRLTNIFVDEGSVKTTNKVMNLLMSKSEAPARRKWMQLKGNQAEIDI